MTLLIGVAHAAPVSCEPLEAARVLAEARVDEAGAPTTHPWLVPGLALASSSVDGELRSVLAELCAPGGELSIAATDRWETAGWSAYGLRLTRSETRGCVLFERSVTLTVGATPGAVPRYALQRTLPLSQTPVGECPAAARWREESVLAGSDGPVRVVLGTQREGEVVVRSEIVARRATPEGWREQVLEEPAPDRLLGGFAGAEWVLRERAGDWLIVATHDRAGTEAACEPLPGQRAWTWAETRWEPHDVAETRAILARHGLWRLAGDDGWFVILAQAGDADRDLLESRKRRLERRRPGELLLLESASFPELNAGYLVVTPPPFADEAAAQEERRAWGRRAATYVKRAWKAADPCASRG